MSALQFPAPLLSHEAERLRGDVRDFLAARLRDLPPAQRARGVERIRSPTQS